MPIVGYQSSGAPTRRQFILETLAARGIKTLGDLDTWRQTHNRGSRYAALVFLVGEDAAILILNNLAILRCSLTKERAA